MPNPIDPKSTATPAANPGVNDPKSTATPVSTGPAGDKPSTNDGFIASASNGDKKSTAS